jgi:hypothetical protein
LEVNSITRLWTVSEDWEEGWEVRVLRRVRVSTHLVSLGISEEYFCDWEGVREGREER